MPSDLSMDDINVNFTEKAHGLLDKYSQTHSAHGKNAETAPFKTMKDVFMMALYVGARSGRPRALDGKRATSPFRAGVLTHEEQMLLRAIAIGHLKEPEVIGEPQRVVRIAEEFANAGIWKLDEILNTSGEEALWDLADHFLEELAEA